MLPYTEAGSGDPVVGHLAPLEAPQAFADLLREFLRDGPEA
jgi:hypothetical protein